MLHKIIKLALLCVTFAAFTGCSGLDSKEPRPDPFPTLTQEQPKSILVLPAINESTAADAPDYYSVTIAPLLSAKGYYVMPQEITTEILRAEGITDGRQLEGVTPAKFGQLFGADAVLFVHIKEWDTNYYVLGGNVTVSAVYELKSTKSGATLWSNSARHVVKTDDNNSGNLLVDLIATAVKTAVQDYMPVAQQVNAVALSPLPLGIKHPEHPSKLVKVADANSTSPATPETTVQ